MKRFAVSIGILVVLAIAVLGLLGPATASAATRSVPSQYSTIQAALNAAASGDTIQIASGNFKEAVTCSKANVTIIGAGKTSTRIYVGAGQDALSLKANNILVKNLTIENTAGSTAGQQQALFCGDNAKQLSFNNCLIKGWQDTLQMKNGSQCYFKSCEIWGSVDFIYDGGTAFFESCTVRQIRSTGGYNAAPSTPSGVRGIVFWGCTINAASGVASRSSYLARVWKAPGEVAHINCTIGSHINTAGYKTWNEGTTSRVAEYPCPSTRASWCKRLTSTSGYTKSAILGSWTPRTSAIDDGSTPQQPPRGFFRTSK